YRPARSIIESYLDHTDPFVRAESIRALASWFECQEHRPTCERIIKYERDFDARIAAISGLGSLALAAGDPSGLKTLAEIVRNSGEKRGHRETAYAGILYFQGVHPRNHPHLTRSDQEFEAAVDWNLILRIEAGAPL
ncbi:MAG TPA: HEAT repeat domain-containing protein, partial [Dehalococcoidia bacterium]|nr:HEAT repeat domain-containing protein [Dehalococcoidia bacterium]